MINSYIDGGIPFVIILTKSDKLSKNQRKQRMDDFLLQIPCADQITFIPFSSLTGEGVDTVRNIIETFNEELIAAPADL
jgi:GTP-binding protein